MDTQKKYDRLKKAFGLLLLSMEPVSSYTSFRIGGPADLLAQPLNSKELIALLKAAGQEKIPVTIMGGGTNTLVSDKGIRGLVIVLTKLKSSPWKISLDSPKASNKDETIICAQGGERLSTVCRFAMEQGLSGLEFAAGIPGTLGGAIKMNAGISERDISRVVAAIDVIDTRTLTQKRIERKDLIFSYRQLDAPDMIIVKADLALTQADPDLIKRSFNQTLEMKNKTQPVSRASAGCFFKNPDPKTPAGKLIEDSGLKGVKINGAKVSDIHANFIVNAGNARCEDILALKNLVQKNVFKKYNIQLETEVKVTGE